MSSVGKIRRVPDACERGGACVLFIFRLCAHTSACQRTMQGFRKFTTGSSHSNTPLKLNLDHLDTVFHRAHARRQQTTTTTEACDLYTFPKPKSLLPVLTNVDIEWDSQCQQGLNTTVDVLLSVQTVQDGLRPVHLWTDVDYTSNKLTTQLNPTWWNASTGAGRVSAQVSSCITPFSPVFLP